MDAIRASGKLFLDTEFPPTINSIGEIPYPLEYPVHWIRAKNLVDEDVKPMFIEDGASQYDITQGVLGDCWFLAASATIAMYKDEFEAMVPVDQDFGEKYCGAFYFNFIENGKKKQIIVDDYLPVTIGEDGTKSLLFGQNKASPNEFWLSLLEKAFAKLHGSYKALQGGVPHWALAKFTGGIGDAIEINEQTKAETLSRQLRRLLARRTILTAGILTSETRNGLMGGHAYSITDVKQIKLRGKSIELIRIRNPHGSPGEEWTGAWSDKSSEWDKCPDEIKEKLDRRDMKDGEFWMTVEDFMDHFTNIFICYLYNKSGDDKKERWNAVCSSGVWKEGVSAGGPDFTSDIYWLNPQHFIEVTDVNKKDDDTLSTIIISLRQDFATFRGFDVYKYNGTVPEELNDFRADKEELKHVRRCLYNVLVAEDAIELTSRYEIEPGTYCVMPFLEKANKEMGYTLRIATENPPKQTRMKNK